MAGSGSSLFPPASTSFPGRTEQVSSPEWGPGSNGSKTIDKAMEPKGSSLTGVGELMISNGTSVEQDSMVTDFL